MGNSAKLSVPFVHAPWPLGRGARVVAQDLLSDVKAVFPFVLLVLETRDSESGAQ